MKFFSAVLLPFLCVLTEFAAEPLRLDARNPHYFSFQGRPIVLVTSGEHYGAVINRDFNYIAYLDVLSRNHLNLTRIWVGPYREVSGSFSIANNTLAPRPEAFITPWPRSATPGAADGASRFDLSRWNPEYFTRLKDFLREAEKRGIVVEVNLFCPYYEDSMWKVSPLNAANNVNGVGGMPRTEVLTMKHAEMVAIQDAMVRKLVAELGGFGNLYYEICNEPYFGGVTLDWQRHIAGVIAEAERKLPARHLISQNIANGSTKIDEPNPLVSIFNFHYSRPADSVALNYALDRAIGNNETGFDGRADSTYRIQGWEFLMAGGALYNNLDYSFTTGHERGDFVPDAKTPGGGSATLRSQLRVLRDFFDRIPFVDMKPARDFIQSGVPEGAWVRVLAQPGKAYAIYLCQAGLTKDAAKHFTVDAGERQVRLAVHLPAGSYEAVWIDTKDGHTGKRVRFTHTGGNKTLESPRYSEDVALRIRSTK
jgi:hypothetical protein